MQHHEAVSISAFSVTQNFLTFQRNDLGSGTITGTVEYTESLGTLQSWHKLRKQLGPGWSALFLQIKYAYNLCQDLGRYY